MPYLKLNTNINADKDKTTKLLGQLSQLVAKETNKPERYVLIEINAGKTLSFAGTQDPLAYLECKSIGLSSKQAKSLSASVCQLLGSSVGIPPDRIYIEFADCPGEFWGWNGSTFG